MSSIQTYNCRGVVYVRIVESYRDPVTKKPKIRVLKNLGRADVLEAENPGIIEKLKQELQESRDLSEKLKQETIFAEIQGAISLTLNWIFESFDWR